MVVTRHSLSLFLTKAAATTTLKLGRRGTGSRSFPRVSFSFSFSTASAARTVVGMGSSGDGGRGALIVLEGLDRCGKTSQSTRLFSFLQEQGFSVESWRFPDRTTSVGGVISSYLANASELDDHTVHLLFSANRWEKRSLMESKLRNRTSIIVDRYSYSGVAFSAAKGLDLEWCKAPEIGLLAPDLVLYLDINPEKAAERGGYGGERYEQLEFQRNVMKQYQMLRDPTWKIIDASLPMEDVEKLLRDNSLECIDACLKGKPLSQLWLKD
ncbi:Thymidylate kinase [Nymphaea thermarum]|nr:Thymidylate kinase [Nymphaea thermarum]